MTSPMDISSQQTAQAVGHSGAQLSVTASPVFGFPQTQAAQVSSSVVRGVVVVVIAAAVLYFVRRKG